METESINRIEHELAFDSEDLLNSLSITATTPPAHRVSYMTVPEMPEVLKNRVIRTNRCFSTKVCMLDSSGSLLLSASDSVFAWKIRTPEGHTVGKLRRNIIGTKYLLRPVKQGSTGCFIKYHDLYSSAGPRMFSVYVDPLDTPHKKSLQERVQKNTCEYVKMVNKPPQFNHETNSYVLNFDGRVTMPSTRNFQIIHPKDTSYISMTFGKVAENEYILDYAYPWCALDAFSVALSSFPSKFWLE
ncbi:tubby [Nematocida major]|uniref:tubby n=1 Tax=Nematocida major TaxID=1912982 RepID=UPI002008385E|nr:tubby [Nematocida major]KAH9386681.1 tubby [Nematocida major]